jgi:hypothetical protein
VLAGCGGGSGPGDAGVDPNAGSFRAMIDRELWIADTPTIQATGDPALRSAMTISGTRVKAGGRSTSMVLALGYINGPNLYPLGVNQGSTAGGTATITDQVNTTIGIWTTDLNGARGTVRVTDLTAERIAGVFEFVATPQPGSTVTDTHTITDGSFDVPLPPLYEPPPADDYGSSISAAINDDAWNAATVVGVGDTAAGALSFGGMTTGISLSFVTAMPVAAGNTYDQTGIQLTANGNGGTWGGSPDDVVSVAVTALDARRVAGTFTATLAPVAGATAPLSIAVGAFDVRIDATQ